MKSKEVRKIISLYINTPLYQPVAFHSTANQYQSYHLVSIKQFYLNDTFNLGHIRLPPPKRDHIIES